MDKLARVDATIHGEVQRVGYRYMVQDTARRLGVKGYVQNMPDGTINVIAEAPKDAIQKFIEAIRIKEPPIDVERIQATYSEPTGEFKYFTIKSGDLIEEMIEGFGAGLKYINLSRAETKEGFQTLGNEMKGEIQTLRTDMKEGFQTLGNEMRATREDINKNFQEMSGRYDAISQNLSQAIKIMQDESTKTRNELIRAVDNLSRLIEEFVKKKAS